MATTFETPPTGSPARQMIDTTENNEMGPNRIDYANPTVSDTYYVLQHSADGSYEVWDCDAFGPWSVAAGPFTGDDGYQRARNAYRALHSPSAGLLR